jgi:uncharacterized protein
MAELKIEVREGWMRMLIVAALVAMGATGAAAQDTEAAFRSTTLLVSATGEVRASPDLAVLTVGVQSEAPTAAAALARNREQMSGALAALKAKGVADADVQTTNLDLQPQYVFENGQPRRLTGYQAGNTVTARLHDLKAVGAVVDALVAAGANQIDSITFDIADRRPLEDTARREAVKALFAKAELYAGASGYRLLRLVQMSEGERSGVIPSQPLPMMRMAAEGVRRTPVAAGELTVQASVTGEYELTR